MQIVAVIVTSGRPLELERLLKALDCQTRVLAGIIVVDNAPVAETASVLSRHPHVRHLVSRRNLGGAGGFAFGILSALADGASHVWLMDDDGVPESDDCLQRLADAACSMNAAIMSPAIVDVDNREKLAFPYRIAGRRVEHRHAVESGPPIRGFAHLFNGALVTSAAFERFGIPDFRLFIRGDEVDFLKRVTRGGGLVVTLPGVFFRHPSGRAETHPILGGRLCAVVPVGAFKQYHFFRNRGYILRRHRAVLQGLSDIVRYPWFYLVSRRGDWRGLRRWLGLMAEGWREEFHPYVAAEPPVANGSLPDTAVVAERAAR